MNPKEFSWSEDQQVTVVNPTDNPYKFKVHNKDYAVGAHKTVKMPGYIAWVYVYGLSTQLAQADGVFNRWNEEDFRPTYYEKLVKSVDALVQDVEEIEEPEVTSTFDEIDEPDEPDTTEEPDQPGEPDKEEQPDPAPAADSQPTPELEREGAAPANIQPMKPAKPVARGGRVPQR
jgi:hypothetical protein